MSEQLSEILGRKHALSPAQDRVFGSVIRMLFRGDLQHSRDGLHMSVYCMPDHLSNELVDKDDTNIVASQKTPVWKINTNYNQANYSKDRKLQLPWFTN